MNEGTTIEEGFKEFGRIFNMYFPAPPDRGYVGTRRAGWYPEKPKRKMRRALS